MHSRPYKCHLILIDTIHVECF